MLKVYKVLEKFHPKKDYGFDISPRYARCLGVTKKGDRINSILGIMEWSSAIFA